MQAILQFIKFVLTSCILTPSSFKVVSDTVEIVEKMVSTTDAVQYAYIVDSFDS